MLLDLGRSEEREEFSFEGDFSIETEDGGTAECRATVSGKVARRGGRLFLEASVASRTEIECSRCLERFELELTTGFDLVFHREGRAQVPDGMEEEDFVLLTSTIEHRFDIFPRLRESILLEFPIRALCRPDCRGLCAVCGENLNVKRCRCSTEETDSPWGALKKLLSREDRS